MPAFKGECPAEHAPSTGRLGAEACKLTAGATLQSDIDADVYDRQFAVGEEGTDLEALATTLSGDRTLVEKSVLFWYPRGEEGMDDGEPRNLSGERAECRQVPWLRARLRVGELGALLWPLLFLL